MTDDANTPEKPALKDASTNPWYVLMTVAGEQDGKNLEGMDRRHGYSRELHARNRRYFNGWMAKSLSEDAKQELIADGRATPEDLADLTDEETAAITQAFADRCPNAEPLDVTQPRCNLAGSEVTARLVCVGFVFSGLAHFERATFSGYAYFRDATFSGVAYFSDATFSGYADFSDATFSGYANFRDATFSGVANFRDATFSGVAYFRDATFSGLAHFERATFSGYANFRDATFSGVADFRDATFSGYADFRDATFSGVANFRDATFSGVADFSDATFSGVADFSDATFKSKTVFANVTFQPPRASPPQFYNAELHEDTDWEGITTWPLPGKDQRPGDFIRAYEKLKLLMGGQSRVHDQLMFQQLELRCREVQDGWSSLASWGSRFFRFTSDYGWSLGKPLWWLVVLILSSAAIIWGEERAEGTTPLEWDNALGVSFANVFSFLAVGRRFLAEEYQNLTLWSEVVCGVQMILGPFLLFLLGVALRNRFRIK